MAAENMDYVSTILCGRRAQSAFSFSAWWSVALGVTIAVFFWMQDESANSAARSALPVLLGCLGLVGSVAGLVIFFGMLAYLLKCDPSGRGWKAFWLFVFLVSCCFGSSLYFFAVYKKQVAHVIAI